MPKSLQEFLVAATKTAKDDLKAALLRIPEDKRAWSPMGDARTALDQVAECAVLNGSTADLMETRKWPEDFDFAGFVRSKDELAKDWGRLEALL